MKKRRGLSSVIGMIFLVIVLSSTIGYFTYGVNLIEQLNDEVITKAMEMQDLTKESFEISNVKIDGGKFNLTIYNSGELPINFTRIWVNNVTDSTWPLQNFTVNKIVTPKQTITNIGQGINLQALESQAYSIKLITHRGNGEEFFINAPNQEPLDLKLIALPETVPDGFRSTLLLTVTNNMTKNNVLLNIKPIMQTPQVTGAATYTLISDMNPTQKSTLDKGDTAYFTWTYEISGTLNDNVIFTTSLQNGLPQNTASATVKINDVLLSQQSETSLTSKSLTTSPNEDLLIFHKETSGTPNGAFQMYSGDPDTGGMSISVETDNPKFFTNNGTAVNISPGIWNASLTYFSAPYPDSLMNKNSNNMKFHFEGNIAPEDSTGNTNGHNLGSGSEMPTYEATGGPHGSGAFRFDDGDYIELNKEHNENDVHEAPDTTSLWFKADDGISDTQYLYHAGKSNWEEYYKILIDTNDNIVFEYLTKINKTPAKCESSGFDYENGNWQHVVAVRPTDNTCKLYINATDVDLTPQNGNTDDDDVKVDQIFVGAEDDNPGDGFNGVIDDLLHWDNYALLSTEVTDLYNTNYGNSAHLVTFNINKTDADGIIQTNIVTDTSYSLKFLDGKANNDFLDSFNYTTTTSNWANFTNSERLSFDMEFVNGLDMDMRIDDTNLSVNPENSFLQFPYSLEIFQSYITIIADQPKTLRVYNGGPSTAWITFDGTRLTFDDVASSNTFAGIILQANATDVNSIQDSKSFPVGTILDLTFSTAKNPPATTGSTGLITAGSYNMKMHITGYDVAGKNLIRTIEFGIVTVT
jgi:hypothetical protein